MPLFGPFPPRRTFSSDDSASSRPFDLSLCIPTYNRIEKLEPLVRRILSCSDPAIEVVVLDNASTDGTLARLSAITDSRLHVYCNEVNRGSLFNGLNVLDKAHGRFAVMLLDKDDVDPHLLPGFRDFLLGQPGLACGYCEYALSVPDEALLYEAGMSALMAIAFAGHHPTGYFFETNRLRQTGYLQRFGNFDFVGHFAGDFIFAELLLQGRGAIYQRPVFAPESEANAALHKSIGTNAAREDAFFSPRGRLKTAIRFSQHIGTLPLSPADKQQLIVKCYVKGLIESTIGYRRLMANEALCAHYHIGTRRIGTAELVATAGEFYRSFNAEAITPETLGAGLLIKMRFNLAAVGQLALKIGLRLTRVFARRRGRTTLPAVATDAHQLKRIMMTGPTLTLAVPTYNRADALELLLATLLVELRGLEGRVAVVLGDNASTDRTPDVLARFVASWDDTTVVRHATNLGMDGNFCGCVERVRTEYFWVIGDDDLPRAGALRALVGLLDRESPDLVYLNSRSLPVLVDNDPAHPVSVLNAMSLDRLAFARRTNVWTTYLSGMIVRTPALIHDSARLRRHAGTQLSQLAWVLEVLRNGNRFIHVRTCCVLATAANTGGYKVLNVFGRHFPDIVRATFSGAPGDESLCFAILRRTAVAYLPALVWGMRESTLGQFEQENAAEVLRPNFGGTLAFSVFLVPIGHASRPVALLALFAARVTGRLIRVWDLLVESLSHTVQPVRC
jgi:glycosyltransferase involved in cell wall biosynthesis